MELPKIMTAKEAKAKLMSADNKIFVADLEKAKAAIELAVQKNNKTAYTGSLCDQAILHLKDLGYVVSTGSTYQDYGCTIKII